MLRDCDATFFAIHASSDKQRYVSLIYSMRPAPKSNGKYAIINTSHMIELFCVFWQPNDAFPWKTNQSSIHDQIRSSWNRDTAADFEIQGHPHSYAIIGWDTSRNLFRNMQFTYRVALFSDHCHVSYAHAYDALLDTHAQSVSLDWNYNNTAF